MDGIKEYPCPNCGGQLLYDPDASLLKCSYCKSTYPVQKGAEKVVEEEIKNFLQMPLQANTIIAKVSYKCSKCGSESDWPADDPAFNCPHCGNRIVNPAAFDHFPITPTGIVPFLISKSEATDAFRGWIKTGLFYQSALPLESVINNLSGLYLPFWTFDCQTNSEWEGEGGRYYYEQQTVRNSQGNMETRSVRRTKWIYRSGSYENFFNDILVCGSSRITQDRSAAVFPYNLNAVQNFNPEFIVGWDAEISSRDTRSCYSLYRSIVDSAVHNACVAACTIDTYRNLRIRSRFSCETYKHILLPVWVCDYAYKGKNYFFLINGQTGKISGTKPFSAGKIAIAVIIAIIIILIIGMLAQSN